MGAISWSAGKQALANGCGPVLAPASAAKPVPGYRGAGSASPQVSPRQGGSIRERSDPGLSPAQDQGVHVMGAFIGVDHLQVHQVAGHTELVADAVATHHVARLARDMMGDVQR